MQEVGVVEECLRSAQRARDKQQQRLSSVDNLIRQVGPRAQLQTLCSGQAAAAM